MGAGDEAIHLPVLDHHGAEVIGVGEDFLRLFWPEIAVALQLFQPRYESRQLGGRARVNNADVIERHFLRKRDLLDLLLAPEHDGRAQLELDEARGGPAGRAVPRPRERRCVSDAASAFGRRFR